MRRKSKPMSNDYDEQDRIDIPEELEEPFLPDGDEPMPFDPTRLDDPDEASKVLDVFGDYQNQLAELENEKESLLRHVADERNRARRALESVDEQRRRSVACVARDVITALDHFDMALAQDLSKATPESLLGGMRAIRGELVRSIAAHGVTEIAPEVGDEFDPNVHAAIARQPIDGVEPGTIAHVAQAGFMIGTDVIRPAKVVVADGEPQEAADESDLGDESEQDE